MIGLEHFLILSATLFSVGLYGALTRSNLITVLMSIELMFNGVNIALVALSRWISPGWFPEPLSVSRDQMALALTGQAFAIFIIAVAAAEVALGLAIIMALFRRRGTVVVADASLMKG